MRRVLLKVLPFRVRPVLRRIAVGLFSILRILRIRNVAQGKLPTGRNDLGRLQQLLGDTADLAASYEVDAPLPELKLVYRPSEEVAPRPVDAHTVVLDATGVGYTFRNNLVFDPQRRVIAENHLTWESLPVSRSFLEPVTHVRGTVAYLSNTEVDNIGHWLCLTLPLVGIYRERLGLEPDYYYVGEPLRAFHIETLAMLGITREQIITRGVSADRLVAAIVNRGHGGFDAEMLNFARQSIGMTQPRGVPTRRLFVGRGNVTFRRMLNEDECFSMLRDKYGFEYVTMDGLTVREQVLLFSSAECIVAPHGAALTHLLWASSSAKVLDLFTYEYRHPWFMEIAAVVGCEFAYVIGEPTTGLAPYDSGWRGNVNRRADLLVDVDEVERAVRALGITSPASDPREDALTARS